MRRLLTILTVTVLTCTSAHAEFDNLHFRNISIGKGLSEKLVLSLEKDSHGFLWVGTSEGLNRYDGYSFKVYRNSPGDSTSISSSFINSIHCDSEGSLWIGTEKGLNRYDGPTDTFEKFKAVNDSLGLLQNLRIRSIHEHQGTLYLGTLEGMIRLDKKTRYMNFFKLAFSGGKMANEIICMTNDKYGMMWIGTYDGLYRYNPQDNSFERFEARRRERTDISNNLINTLYISDNDSNLLYIGGPNGLMVYDVRRPGEDVLSLRASDGGLADDEIKNITRYSDDIILLGTGNGVTLFNIHTGRRKTFRSSLYDPTSLPSNHIKTSLADKENKIIWLGTENGLAQLDLNRRRLDFTRLTTKDNSGLTHRFVAYDLDVCDNDIWMVSREGVTRMSPKGNERTYTLADGLQHRVCKSLFRDSFGTLWVGTNNGVNWYDPVQDHFRKVTHNPNNGAPLKYIYSITEDSDHDIVTNISSGLMFMTAERASDGRIKDIRFKTVSISDMIHSDNCDIGYVETDKRSGVWFAATMEGLFHYDKKTGVIRNFKSDGDDPHSLLSNRVYSLHADRDDNIWIGTDLGLCCYLPDKDTFVRYDDIDLSQSIRMITSDNFGRLWIGAINRLIMFDPHTKEKIVCDLYSEFGFDEITYNSSCHAEGEIWFGGDGGYIHFNPKEISINSTKAPLLIHTFDIWGKEFLLNDSLKKNRKIVLGHNENSINIEFSLLNYSPAGNRYLYRLQGHDKQWQVTGGDHNYANYMNLQPGHYTFCLKACNSDNIWSDDEPQLEIIIRQPLHMRWWAWTLYAILLAGLILLANYFIKARMRLANELKMEKMERLKLEELNIAKMRFFTNISHDFKTPLSLILGPIENLISKIDDKEQLAQLQILQSNARILSRLINQIMDLRRLDNGKASLDLKCGEIISFTRNVFGSFDLYAKENDINYTFDTEITSLQMCFDSDKLEKILFNLISNAFKFTNKGGMVSVRISAGVSDQMECVSICISDTGGGISKEEQEHIFERFYQGGIPVYREEQGSGIGLAIVKDFVELHKGKITLESEIGRGSSFTFTIPVDLTTENDFAEEGPGESAGGIRILVVEDNKDMLDFIRMILKDKYEVHTAVDGNTGYAKARNINPDLIISDIMMPDMDGYQLLKKIRTEMFTSHIPVILLTARSDEESRREAYEAGADGYICKPFSVKTLIAKVEMLIAQRQKLQEKYRIEVLSNPTEMKLESENDIFIDTIVKAIEANIDDSDFGIQDLCEITRWSHQQVYRKVRALTGESINEFIRTVRLKRAAHLLSETGGRVSEVMYAVGFNSHSYFTKCFKEKYGVSPREWAESNQKTK